MDKPSNFVSYKTEHNKTSLQSDRKDQFTINDKLLIRIVCICTTQCSAVHIIVVLVVSLSSSTLTTLAKSLEEHPLHPFRALGLNHGNNTAVVAGSNPGWASLCSGIGQE